MARARRVGTRVRATERFRGELADLAAFAAYLNVEPRRPLGGTAPHSPLAILRAQHDATYRVRLEGWRLARDIAERGLGQSSFVPLPLEALHAFNDLAARTPLTYKAWRYAESPEEARILAETGDQAGAAPLAPAPESMRHYVPSFRFMRTRGSGRGRTALELGVESSSAAIDAIAGLARYLMNSARDRLRRCPRCSRWFVDASRNASKRWCSEKCHARAWSRAARRARNHSQYRPKRGARR